MKHIMPALLSMFLFCGSVFFLGGCGNAEIKSKQPKPVASVRHPIVGRTFVFSRGQFKYPLYGNYLHIWLDRPQPQDRSLLSPGEQYNHINMRSFQKQVELGQAYGLDGFAFIAENPGMTPVYDYIREINIPGFSILPEFCSFNDEKGRANKAKFLANLLATASTFRLGGKVVFTTVENGLTPEQWKDLIAYLRQKCGDKFMIIPECEMISGPNGPSKRELSMKFMAAGSLPVADKNAVKKYLREYLDVCDGVYLGGDSMMDQDGKYSGNFYSQCLAPLYREVLAEPKYTNKYFAMSAAIGFFNPDATVCKSEDGTKFLRHSFETAMNAGPDIIVLPEWDEVNENTCFEPTLYNSSSTQRIIKYYMHKIRGESPTPNPNDDVAIPDLVVSYRKAICLGETFEIELLNIPDSDSTARYGVEVELKDQQGKVVKSFPRAEFTVNELKDTTLSMPVAEMAFLPVLWPAVKVTNPHGKTFAFDEGLQPVRLYTTRNWDFKWAKHPLRDICRPTKAEVKLNATSNPPEISATFECNEEIASLEVLEDDDETYAVDPQKEYYFGDDVVTFCFGWRALRSTPCTGTIKIRNGDWRWPNNGRDFPKMPWSSITLNSNLLTIAGHYQNASWYHNRFYFGVPKKDINQAVLEFDLTAFKTNIPLKSAYANGIYTVPFGGTVTLEVERYDKLINHPFHLHSKTAAFLTPLRPETADSVFHVRLITESGKIYRSRPFILPRPPYLYNEKALVHVYSEQVKHAVPVETYKVRVPNLVYDFDPLYGAIFHTAAGRPFYGHLGGYADSSSGRGGGGGGDGTPFHFGTRNYPDKATNCAPAWVQEGGTNCLKFDGIGNFILFPHEVLPRRSGFTLSFEIKPLSLKPQILFIHHGYYIGSLCVKMENGKISGSYVGYLPKAVNNDFIATYSFNPELSVPMNEWSKITVIYDQSNIIFKVNEKSSPAFPCPGPGLYGMTSVFGGFGKCDDQGVEFATKGKLQFFEGYLRAFSILHLAERP